MKKIDAVLKENPELKILKPWLIQVLLSKEKHPIKNVFKRYPLRKPKQEDKAIDIIKNSQDGSERFWAFSYIDFYYWGYALLGYLNKCFKKIKEYDGFRNFLKNLKNKDQFFDTISEIEFNSYFAKRYTLGLEPKIRYDPNKPPKRLDSKIKLNGRDVYFEIFTPRLYEPLLKSSAVIAIPNRSKGKFLDKLRDQLIPIKDIVKNPIILVINGSYSEIDEYDISNAILGQAQFTLLFNKQTRETVDEYWSRNNNSISEVNPLADCISAVLFYKRHVRPWGVEFKKELILNKNPKYPLDAKEYKRLMRFDLSKI